MKVHQYKSFSCCPPNDQGVLNRMGQKGWRLVRESVWRSGDKIDFLMERVYEEPDHGVRVNDEWWNPRGDTYASIVGSRGEDGDMDTVLEMSNGEFVTKWDLLGTWTFFCRGLAPGDKV